MTLVPFQVPGTGPKPGLVPVGHRPAEHPWCKHQEGWRGDVFFGSEPLPLGKAIKGTTPKSRRVDTFVCKGMIGIFAAAFNAKFDEFYWPETFSVNKKPVFAQVTHTLSTFLRTIIFRYLMKTTSCSILAVRSLGGTNGWHFFK